MTLLTVIAALIVLVGVGTAIVFMAAMWHIQCDGEEESDMGWLGKEREWGRYLYRGCEIVIRQIDRHYQPAIFRDGKQISDPLVPMFGSPIDALADARNRIIALIAREQEHAA